MRILNLGSLNVDYVYQVPHIVLPGETISSRSLEVFPGGKGANQSAAIAKAGGDVWHAGIVGEDGRWMIDVLADAGVHHELISVYDGRTGHAVIQVDAAGENSIFLFGGGNMAITESDIDRCLSSFVAGDLLVLQNEVAHVPYAISAARRKGMRVCLTPAPFSDEIRTWPLDDVSILMVNMTEATGLAGRSGSGEELARMLSAEFPDAEIVITAGKAGAYFAHGDRLVFESSRPAKVVDTTAAGDTFLGFYLVAREQGADAPEALGRAAAAAAISVSRPGAMSSIPRADEVL